MNTYSLPDRSVTPIEVSTIRSRSNSLMTTQAPVLNVGANEEEKGLWQCDMAMLELLDTEMSYCADLEYAVQVNS